MKKKEKTLLKNTVIILISKFCTQFLSFFLLPIFTSVLSTEEYGTFDLITTYAFLLIPFMTIQLEHAIFRFLVEVRQEENKEKSSEIISTGFAGILMQLLLFSIFYFFIISIFKIHYGSYIYIYSLSYMFVTVMLQVSRGVGDNICYAIASIIVGLCNTILCFIFVYKINMGLFGLVLAGIISNFSGGLFILLRKKLVKELSVRKYNVTKLKELCQYSLPLIPNSLSSWIINISDKVMISYFIGVGSNGIYSVSTKFSILLSHIYSVFNLSWTESAAVNANDEEREKFFSSTVMNLFKICFCICLFTIGAMPIIFKVMIHPSFIESYTYIPLLIIGTIFEILSGLLGAIYISLKLSKNIAISTCISGIVNVLINVIFMKRYGIYVACISTIISYLLLTVYRIIDLKKYINLKFEKKIFISMTIAMVIIIYFYYKNSIMISIISSILIILYTCLLNKKMILEAWKDIKIKGKNIEKY